MRSAFRVLLADDTPTNRLILSASLRKSGYEILEAVDGDEAVQLATRERPDLVLLDVDMPKRDGFAVCELLKSSAETAATPVIFITGKTDPASIERAFAVGGSDYVTKPFQLSEVKSRVAVHLEVRRAARELADSHARLLRAQKLESIGQLAAGIAHEINTPAQYVGDNLHFLREAFESVVAALESAERLAAAVAAAGGPPGPTEELRRSLDQADVEYLRKEVPNALQQSIEGISRVSKIVRAMKEFSHPGSKEKTCIDLNRAIDSTVTVARNEWKYVAEVVTDFEPDLPPVPCLPGELNQVILNMLVNAAHAIADVVGDGSAGKGTITITTRRAERAVEVRIADTGCGIPEANRERIFDPFFTTKEVGRGTGQGLAIAHDVVVDKHGGTIEVESKVGKGTTFTIRIPLADGAGLQGVAA